MDDYKSNSDKSRSVREPNKETSLPDKKVNKVVTGKAREKKKGGVQKITDVFISEDISSVKSFVLMDVIIPTVKETLLEIVKMSLFGTSAGGHKNSNYGYSTRSRESYQRYYDKPNDRRERESQGRGRSGFEYNDLLFDTRGDADAVLMELDELIEKYGVASIMDLYSSAGLQCEYTYDKYGWTDLRSAEVIRARMEAGYYIRFPKALPIN